MSHLHLTIYENLEESLPYNDKEMFNYCCTVLNNQWKWANSAFHRSRRNIHKEKDLKFISLECNCAEDEDGETCNHEYAGSEHQADSWENISGNAPDRMTEYVRDLTAKGMSQTHIKKVCAALMSRQLLEFHEVVLFDLYFIDDLSTREIAEKCKLPTTAVHGMLTDMKNSIREKVNKMLN